jgi:hypothetical protein
MFSPEGDSSIPPAQVVQARPVHKWPLRPGVLVHVNGTHSLSVGRLPQQQYDGAVSTSTPKNTPTKSNSLVPKHNMCRKDRIKKAARRLKKRHGTSVSSLQPDDTNQHSRASRILQMFSSDANKYHPETLPGVIHGKSGGKEAFSSHRTLYKELEFRINYAFMNSGKINAVLFYCDYL